MCCGASVCAQCRYWTRSRDLNCESERYNLYKYWARFLYFFKEQPLNLVRYDLKTNKVIPDVYLLQINVAAEEFTANMLLFLPSTGSTMGRR